MDLSMTPRGIFWCLIAAARLLFTVDGWKITEKQTHDPETFIFMNVWNAVVVVNISKADKSKC